MRLPLLLCLVFLLSALAPLSPARASDGQDSCTGTIEATPFDILAPGVWCLTEDLVHTGFSNAITVQTADVTIDCNHFSIDATALPSDSNVYGVLGYSNAYNLVVRNCDFRGFFYGITVYAGGLIEDNVIQQGRVVGIYLEGDNSVIRRNRIRDIGNSTSGFQWAYGILAFGDVDIADNTIEGLTATPGSGYAAIGIIANDGLTPGQAFRITGNRVGDLHPDGEGDAIGISTLSEGALVIRDNVFFGPGGTRSFGVYCLQTPHTHITGNIAFDFAYPMWGCTPDVGNTIKP